MGYNKITLYGGQTCDYLYVQKTAVDINQFSSVNSEPKEWNDDTLLFSNFNGDLVAGDSTLTNIKGYEIRRKRGSEPYTEYVATIQESNTQHVIDYAVANNSQYTYYLYPTSQKSEDEEEIILSPAVSEEVKTGWKYWSLIVVDETDEENVFYLNKMFKFELNLATDDMNNNAIVSVTPNFTKYPTVQYAPSNYWSGGLTSMCGFISCNDVEYIQTPNLINELKELTTDTRRKFLKDMDGNIWEVRITAPVTISTEDKTVKQIKSVKISWTEVEEVSGISIINNPNASTVSWLLTETGEAVPYIDYVWGDQYKWDDSYKWTGRDDILDVDISNMGRDLFSKEGD